MHPLTYKRPITTIILGLRHQLHVFKLRLQTRHKSFHRRYLIDQARGLYWETTRTGTGRAQGGSYKNDQYGPEQAWLKLVRSLVLALSLSRGVTETGPELD